MTEIQNIAYSMLELTDSIVKRKIKYSVVIALYDRLVLPFFHRQIQSTSDQEIKQRKIFHEYFIARHLGQTMPFKKYYELQENYKEYKEI